ncbi:adenosylcobinamide-GDP ribazoletransferase [Natronospora cellulosivora (SeqCode)]
MKGFLLMITFLTRIPIKYPFQYREEDFIKGIIWMPAIGLIIGLLLWGISFISYFLDRIVVSIIICFAYIWITGALHIDGLADTVDGVFSNREKSRVLEIMKDSRIGAFGVLAIFFLLAFNIILVNLIDFRTLIIWPVLGRSSAILLCYFSQYLREMGIAKGFVENTGLKEVVFSKLLLIIIALLIDYRLIPAILIVLYITSYFIGFFKKKIGGITGDNIGFIIELSQTIFLFLTYLLTVV